MFDLFLYAFAVLFVLLCLGQSSPEQPQLPPPSGEDSIAWLFEQFDLMLADPDEGTIAQHWRELYGEPDPKDSLTDQLELLAIGLDSFPSVSWAAVSTKQKRALCQLYSIPCSKRGAVNAAAIAQLKKAA